MKLLKDTLYKNKIAILIWAIINIMNALVFYLYNLLEEAFIYTMIVSLIILVVMILIDYIRAYKKEEYLKRTLATIQSSYSTLPSSKGLIEDDYQMMIRTLGQTLDHVITEKDKERTDMVDYYTTWVHQIKTPISVMKMKLSNDTKENRALSLELFRIEQYVDMVLQYIRLGSSTNDLVIKEHDLDELIKETIRKFAGAFIEKRLTLNYEDVHMKVVTDKKWMTCILDQLISNAIKYTNEGGITIKVEDSILSITDTGIGIASSDLPRIFEKGYTGANGRLGEKSSGLGLYLSKKAADKLSIALSVESTQGKGSTFFLNLKQK